MFVETDGPTALRAKIVRALSLSLDVVEISGSGGPGRFCAALGAVWNGRKGYVAILLRRVDEPALRRFVFDQPLLTEEALASAIDEGIAFVESMGFTLDHPEFAGLDTEEQGRRLNTWNDIRKTHRSPRHLGESAAPVRSGNVPRRRSSRRSRRGSSEETEVDGPDPFEGWDREATLDGDGEGEAAPREDPEPEAAPLPEAGAEAASQGSGVEAPAAGAETQAAPAANARDSSSPGKTALGRLALVRKGGRLDPFAKLLSYF